MRDQDTTTMYVDWSHMSQHDAELAQAIELEFYRFEPLLRNSLRDFIGRDYPEFVLEGEEASSRPREFFVSFYNLPKIHRIRALRTERIGKIVSVSGTVTRTTDVGPHPRPP